MKVFYLNNTGGGFASHVEIAPGTSVASFFAKQMPGCDAADYLVRVNRQPVPADQILQENDRVSVTPTKIAGAA